MSHQTGYKNQKIQQMTTDVLAVFSLNSKTESRLFTV